MSKMLTNLDGWLVKATAHAEAVGFDAETFVQARLHLGQHPLVNQVQLACDTAKGAGARLSGAEIPSHPDTETTMAQLRDRIRKTVGYLETVTPESLEQGATQEITISFLPGKAAKGADYVVDMALPNFYFHVTTAYAILRHHGVDVGKRDFIGSVRLYDIG